MGDRRSVLGAGVLSLLVLTASGRAAAAAPEKWPPISDADRALKDCPGQPGAPAVYLYREEITDHDDMVFRAFRRLKVLTAAGRRWANIEIPFTDVWTVGKIQARVVRPDGESRDFTGEFFEKTVARVGRFEIKAKAFALPAVDVGSIIDYRYELVSDRNVAIVLDSQDMLDGLRLRRGKPEEGGAPDDAALLSWPIETWDIQSPLFTRKARYVYVPINRGQISTPGLRMRLAWVAHGPMRGLPEMKDSRVVIELDDIPPWETEEFMPPEELQRMGVKFFFCDDTMLSAEDYWRRECAAWRRATERFLDQAGDAASESRRLVSRAGTPLEQLKALYERAQRIRNWSYDKTMTYARRKEQKVKDNRNVADVLRRNGGLRSDITRAFVALARAAGFSADVARVVTRDDKSFHEKLLGLCRQFDSEVAVVNVDGQDMFLDPATPYCPLGVVRWSCSDTTYVSTSGDPASFRTSPVAPPEKALTRREFALRLDLQGNLSGSARVSYAGQEALVRRLDHIDSDDRGVSKDLEAEMTEVLPEGASVSLRELDNMDNSEDEIRAEFEVTIPRAAAVVGGRMLLPASPARLGPDYSFRSSRRSSSVYFPYPRRESDDIVVTLPAGVKLEATPAVIRKKRSFSEYALTCAVEDGTKLHVRRDLVIGQSRIPAYLYPVLKVFFEQVRSGDEGQLVLALAQK
jgi:hypothetical protein